MGSWSKEYIIAESRDAEGKPLVQKVLRMRKHGPTGFKVHLVSHVFGTSGVLTDTVELTGREMEDVAEKWQNFKEGVRENGD